MLAKNWRPKTTGKIKNYLFLFTAAMAAITDKAARKAVSAGSGTGVVAIIAFMVSAYSSRFKANVREFSYSAEGSMPVGRPSEP